MGEPNVDITDSGPLKKPLLGDDTHILGSLVCSLLFLYIFDGWLP